MVVVCECITQAVIHSTALPEMAGTERNWIRCLEFCPFANHRHSDTTVLRMHVHCIFLAETPLLHPAFSTRILCALSRPTPRWAGGGGGSRRRTYTHYTMEKESASRDTEGAGIK